MQLVLVGIRMLFQLTLFGLGMRIFNGDFKWILTFGDEIEEKTVSSAKNMNWACIIINTVVIKIKKYVVYGQDQDQELPSLSSNDLD